MSDRLLSWFQQRRKSKTLVLAQHQIISAFETVDGLEKALSAFYKGDREEALQHLERLFQKEIEIDDLRRTVFEELTRGDLPSKFREDLKSLIGRLDRMADHVKDAARNIKILIDAEVTIPKDILELNLKISKNLVECTSYLNKSIEMLGTNPSQATNYAIKVDEYEGLIDEKYLQLKTMFIKKADSLNAPTLIILKDLVDAMERAADMCDDTADYVRTLAIAETK